jgi:hypothetical protein
LKAFKKEKNLVFGHIEKPKAKIGHKFEIKTKKLSQNTCSTLRVVKVNGQWSYLEKSDSKVINDSGADVAGVADMAKGC